MPPGARPDCTTPTGLMGHIASDIRDLPLDQGRVIEHGHLDFAQVRLVGMCLTRAVGSIVLDRRDCAKYPPRRSRE